MNRSQDRFTNKPPLREREKSPNYENGQFSATQSLVKKKEISQYIRQSGVYYF